MLTENNFIIGDNLLNFFLSFFHWCRFVWRQQIASMQCQYFAAYFYLILIVFLKTENYTSVFCCAVWSTNWFKREMKWQLGKCEKEKTGAHAVELTYKVNKLFFFLSAYCEMSNVSLSFCFANSLYCCHFQRLSAVRCSRFYFLTFSIKKFFFLR